MFLLLDEPVIITFFFKDVTDSAVTTATRCFRESKENAGMVIFLANAVYCTYWRRRIYFRVRTIVGVPEIFVRIVFATPGVTNKAFRYESRISVETNVPWHFDKSPSRAAYAEKNETSAVGVALIGIIYEKRRRRALDQSF